MVTMIVTDQKISELDGFFDVVGDDQDRLDRELPALPQPGQLAAQVRRGEHVQRGERLIHQQRVGLDGQGPGEPDPLPHAAGQLLRVGGLEAVQADQVDRAQRLVAPHVLGYVAGCMASSTFCCTVSQGSRAKDWKTMATPGFAPFKGVPR